MNKHVHAELIKQWADGAKIEFRSPQYNVWLPCLGNCPSWNSGIEFRVAKPKWQQDLLDAVKRGDEVQIVVSGNWHRSSINKDGEKYVFVNGLTKNSYRIKPREVVRYMTVNSGRVVHLSSNQEPHANIKLTLDYKYGNPIAVELIGSAKKDY